MPGECRTERLHPIASRLECALRDRVAVRRTPAASSAISTRSHGQMIAPVLADRRSSSPRSERGGSGAVDEEIGSDFDSVVEHERLDEAVIARRRTSAIAACDRSSAPR